LQGQSPKQSRKRKTVIANCKAVKQSSKKPHCLSETRGNPHKKTKAPQSGGFFKIQIKKLNCLYVLFISCFRAGPKTFFHLESYLRAGPKTFFDPESYFPPGPKTFFDLKITFRPGGKRFLTPKITFRPGGKRFLTPKVTFRPGGKRFSPRKLLSARAENVF
jgi:hypothetical protein